MVLSKFGSQRALLPYYRRMQPCMNAAAEVKTDELIRIFAKDLTREGKKSYTYCTKENFVRMYFSTQAKNRVYYEVIPRGSPCHCFFNIDYHRTGVEDDLVVLTSAFAEFSEFVCSHVGFFFYLRKTLTRLNAGHQLLMESTN